MQNDAEQTVQDSFYRARLLSAWDAEYQTVRCNILTLDKKGIYDVAEVIWFIETLDHYIRHLHFTDEECVVLLQHSEHVMETVANCMESTEDMVLGALDKLLGREKEEL